MDKCCIGIDLGGTFIKFGLLDGRRRLVRSLQLPTPTGGGAKEVVAQMVLGARSLMEQAGVSVEQVPGAGIGSPGPLKISEGIVIGMPNIPGMNNVPLRDMVSAGLGVPAVLENDANAAAYGEYISGPGQGAGDLVLLTLGTGLGSGIVIDGRVLHGSHDIGAELGHMIVDPGGEPCGCGQRGCLERYCSATYLAQHAARLIERQNAKGPLARALAEKGAIDARDVNEARKAGDELAKQVWDRGAYYLAVGCVNVCRLFDPDRIVLSGGMAKAGEDLMQPLQEHFRRLHWSLAEPMTEIVFSRLGNDAGMIGSAGLAWQAFSPADSTTTSSR